MYIHVEISSKNLKLDPTTRLMSHRKRSFLSMERIMCLNCTPLKGPAFIAWNQLRGIVLGLNSGQSLGNSSKSQ